MSANFEFMLKLGATPEAVAVLNDQPYIFTILLVVIVVIALQITLHWYIHYATLKPEQIKAKEAKKKAKKDKKGGAKPAAAR